MQVCEHFTNGYQSVCVFLQCIFPFNLSCVIVTWIDVWIDIHFYCRIVICSVHIIQHTYFPIDEYSKHYRDATNISIEGPLRYFCMRFCLLQIVCLCFSRLKFNVDISKYYRNEASRGRWELVRTIKSLWLLCMGFLE